MSFGFPCVLTLIIIDPFDEVLRSFAGLPSTYYSFDAVELLRGVGIVLAHGDLPLIIYTISQTVVSIYKYSFYYATKSKNHIVLNISLWPFSSKATPISDFFLLLSSGAAICSP